jgi:hypothetical protein
MNNHEDILRTLRKLKADGERQLKDLQNRTIRIRVNKKTRRIRFEDETEDEVTVIIERKDA